MAKKLDSGTVVEMTIPHDDPAWSALVNGNGSVPEAVYDEVMDRFAQVGETSDEVLGDEREFDVPGDEIFTALEESAYIIAADLRMAGDRMIETFPELVFLQDFRVEYLWKRKGGSSGGIPQFGGAAKGSTLLRLLGNVDFVFWLSADHCRDFLSTELQRDAALYHQLAHASLSGQGKPEVHGHDAEMFGSEIERFGLWSLGLKRVGKAMEPHYRQADLGI